MATHHRVQELASGLRVQVHQDLERWERLLVAAVAAVAAVAVGFPAALYLGGWSWAILSIIGALTALGVARGKSAELQVTNVEFITKGDLGRRVRTPRIVCTGDVRQIEFREGGLYAVTAHSTVCLLPLLDFNATAEVIRAIENKFPGLAEGWRSRQPFKENYLGSTR
jgi:hypothetical protein